MEDRTKLAAAVASGYVLGRTKKGKAAVRLAMWLNGQTVGGLARDQVRRITESPEVAKLATQIGQPLVDATRRAAIAAVEARVAGLADNLEKRTAMLTSAAGLDEKAPAGETDEADETNEADDPGPEGEPESEKSDSEDTAPQHDRQTTRGRSAPQRGDSARTTTGGGDDE